MKFTFGENTGNVIKNNVSIKVINEKVAENNNEDSDDEEKYDIKVNSENDINYDDMLKKKDDDIKFLDFDNFLDVSNTKIKKKNNDNNDKNELDDLCNIRYEEDDQKNNAIINKKVSEALKDAADSSDEEELKKNKDNKKFKI